MPDDLIKAAVLAALLADGWGIGHDPYTLDCDEVSLFIDLGCERPAADGTVERIAVEIKTLPPPYSVYDLHQAVGQVVFYRELLADLDPGRRCYLAVARGAFDGLLCRARRVPGAGPAGRPDPGDRPGDQGGGSMAEVNVIDCSIREVLEWMARGLRGVPKPHVDTVTLHDPATGHYRLMRIGWHDGKRECKTVAHIRVADGRVYVEEDNTDAQVAERLVRAGLPRDQVVSGYYIPADAAPARAVA